MFRSTRTVRMGEKRFNSRRQWHNTAVILLTAPFVAVFGVLIGVVTGAFVPLFLMLALLVIGVLIALTRDATPMCQIHLTDGKIVLVRAGYRLEIPAEQITDASLIDRAGARNYMLTRSMEAGDERSARSTYVKEYLRFCTVDIGLRSFTLGLGRGVIDRMPKARHDMVLLRLNNGQDLLLAPEYNQDLVHSIVRLIRKSEEA